MTRLNCDPATSGVYGLLQTRQAFQNPSAAVITQAETKLVDRIPLLDGIIADIDPLDPELTLKTTTLQSLQGSLMAYSGRNNVGAAVDVINSPVGQAMEYTNFLAGQSEVFPVSAMTSVATDPSVMPLLASMDHLTVLSFVGSMPLISGGLCEPPPGQGDDPCGHLTSIFGLLGGVINAIMDAIGNAADQIWNLLQGTWVVQQLVALMQTLASAITEMMDKIRESLDGLIDAVQKALHWARSFIMSQFLKLDPCVRAVIGGVATPQLQELMDTIPEPTLPSLPEL